MRVASANRRGITVFTLSLFVLFLFPFFTYTQTNTGNLMGFIYKSDNKTPVKDGQIILEDIKTNKVFKSNITDKTGDYRLMNVPAGEYKVSIRIKKQSYKITKVDFLVKIMPGKTMFISFSLKGGKFPVAIIIVGTAAAIGAGMLIGTLLCEECEQSPTQR